MGTWRFASVLVGEADVRASLEVASSDAQYPGYV
jgi:hypothetical protein